LVPKGLALATNQIPFPIKMGQSKESGMNHPNLQYIKLVVAPFHPITTIQAYQGTTFLPRKKKIVELLRNPYSPEKKNWCYQSTVNPMICSPIR